MVTPESHVPTLHCKGDGEYNTMATVREGNVNIMLEQDKIRTAQQSVQNSVMQNLKELSREKSLIAAGNKELDLIKRKIDETNKEIVLQSLERTGHHQKVISDLDTIQKQAKAIFQRIDDSTQRVLNYHQLASQQYEETLKNLQKINETVNYLTKLFSLTHAELEQRIEWIKLYLGESGEELSKLATAVLHIAYLLMGMLLASFLNLPFISRAAIVLLLPLNLMLVYEDRSGSALDFAEITVTLVVITCLNSLVNVIIGYVASSRSKQYLKAGDGMNPPSNDKGTDSSRSMFSNLVVGVKSFCGQFNLSWIPLSSLTKDEINDPKVTSSGKLPDQDSSSMNPPHRRTSDHRTNVSPKTHQLVSRWLVDSDLTARPPSVASGRSGSPRNMCSAQCRTGRPCRNLSVAGREFCRIHELGGSIFGDK